MPKRYARDVHWLARRALAAGATRSGFTLVEWDLAGNCEQPYITEHMGRPERVRQKEIIVDDLSGSNRPLTVEIATRCRKCASCLRVRRNLWTHRAEAETKLRPRTWMGTITLRPEALYRLDILSAREFGVGYDELSKDRKFRLLDACVFREIAKMLKRIRASYKGRIRFMCVTEQHKSGNPHWHLLVHQCDLFPDLTYRLLEGQWHLGFTKWKLVTDVAQARYVAKYCSKSNVARVRASLRYGETVSSSDTDQVGYSHPMTLMGET